MMDTLLAVNPVPWARAQMAFTLAFHIILVPLGVSWAFMTLIANYRASSTTTPTRCCSAQRWSKYMAVTFAVGAVTGTVLSFEFGLLWPRFMGQWGDAFGVPFAFEGIFFFTEAIFVSIYIFGWRRLKPWAHFWTGVPIVLAGIFGSVSVVAANAWMNAPSGLHAELGRRDRRASTRWSVIFNDAMPLMAAHMVVAAYVVGGFLDRVGVRRRHAARPPRPLPPARVPHPVHGRRHRHPDPDGRRRLARPVGLQQPAGEVRRDRAGARRRRATCPRRCSATSTTTAPSPAASRSPAWRRGCRTRRPAQQQSSRGSTRCRPTSSPRSREVNTVHLAWDVMVGLGTLLYLLALWYWAAWLFRRDMPKSRWFLRIAASTRACWR